MPRISGKALVPCVLLASLVFGVAFTAEAQTQGHPGPHPDPYCFDAAGQAYNISPLTLWAISRTESRHDNSARNVNTNGTSDHCHMQINSSWRSKLGEERWRALADPCYCTYVGAWILAQCMSSHGNTWEAVGCYNAKSRQKRTAYATRIYKTLAAVPATGWE